MGNLAEVWGEVKSLLSEGVSLIPVRDKNETTKVGDVYVAKSPYAKWKEFQNRRITEQELWMVMEEKDTTAVAIVCGQISGNIEVIDVDVKYKPGIDATILTDLRNFYPDLFSRLRIHRTPSGGLHIIYRIDNHEVPGNQKLAGRLSTESEIELQKQRGIKKPSKEVNFLETRGEGGYILAPPSLGYSVHKENPIPVITWEERCSLITLCETYTEIIKEAPKPKTTKTQDSIYDENPFEHFNRSADPIALFEEFGWKYSHENHHFIWFTRPDKQRGVSASWNKIKQIYFIFTSSTELESNKGYHPSTILANLKFDGDKSKTYYYLTQNGYGKVKKKVEHGIIKKAALSGKSIPANFSEDAKRTFEELKISIKEDHPYGIFWQQDEEEKITISREALYHVSNNLGFRFFKGEVVQIVDKLIYEREDRFYFDTLKNYIQEEDAELYEDICNAYESFIQRAGKFSITRLEELDTNQVLNDTADTCFKFYTNCYIEITSESITSHSYDEFDYLIWQRKMLNREWNGVKVADSLYEQYLLNATGEFGIIPDNVKKVIGYLSHDFKSESAGYIIVLTEKVQDPRDGGGSGKNVFGNILKSVTTICTVPGSSIQFNDKFLSPWNRERVYFLPDIPKKIDWPFLKEMATGSGLWNRKFINESPVATSDMPKLLLNTNYSFDDADGGLKRRIIPIEFNPYYTVNGGVDTVHGKMFPHDFDKDDWAAFDYFVAECIQLLFQSKGKIKPDELSQAGWEKKFKNQYGEQTFEFIEENIKSWIELEFVSTKDFNEKYHLFCAENDVPQKYRAGQKLMNMALKEYCVKHKHGFEPRAQRKINSIVTKGKCFSTSINNNTEVSEEDAPF